jgi:uncharacterized protein
MRGVAILGVLVAYTMWNLGNLPEDAWTGADRVVSGATGLLVDNKFLTMFAFLFGLGVCQQWRRWEVAGHDPAPLHLRRMTFLLTVGLLHAALLRNGDILARPVRAVGRMAFTNYLVQALLIVPVCLAFGLFDAMTPTLALGLALSVTALQVWYSTRWLASRESGPLERLWRRVTYGSRRAGAPQPATAT